MHPNSEPIQPSNVYARTFHADRVVTALENRNCVVMGRSLHGHIHTRIDVIGQGLEPGVSYGSLLLPIGNTWNVQLTRLTQPPPIVYVLKRPAEA